MRPVVKGSVDQSCVVRFVDSADGTPETGVSDATAGLALWYRREGGLKVDITPASLAALNTAHADGGVEHIADGYVRIDLPDAAVGSAAGVNGVAVGGSATDMVVVGCYIPLWDVNPYDAVRGGMTALPNAAAEAAGGLYTRGTGAGQINQPANGSADVNVVTFTAGAITADAIATGAVDADALAVDAVVEIQAGLATAVTAASILEDTGTTLPAQIDDIEAGGGGVTLTRSTGALLGTNESSGVTINNGQTTAGEGVDLLGDNTSTGVASFFLCFTAPSDPAGTVDVTVWHRRVSSYSYADPALTFHVAGNQSGRIYLGRADVGRYASVSVANKLTSGTITGVAVLYELEKTG